MHYTFGNFSFKTLVLVLVFALTASAQQQAGVAASKTSFVLRGTNVTPGQGVPGWPVLNGDSITVGTSPVSVTFPDGSVVYLSPGAQAQVQLVNGKPVVNLQSGAVHYALKSVSSVKIVENGKEVAITSPVGDSQIGTAALATGWWTAGHTVGVVAATVGATALGVGLTRRTPSPQ